jgi:copper ion binding protein
MNETFNVPGMSCGHCKSSIEGALGPVAGVRDASVDLDQKRVDVDFDEAVTDRASLVRAIESAGYEVAG